MKIKKCSQYLKENLYGAYGGDDYDNPYLKQNFMYHSTEEDNVDNIMKNGLVGDIYLTTTPEEAREHHPVILKIDVRNRVLKMGDECFVVNGVPSDQIEVIGLPGRDGLFPRHLFQSQ
jgi:hypothetical protein